MVFLRNDGPNQSRKHQNMGTIQLYSMSFWIKQKVSSAPRFQNRCYNHVVTRKKPTQHAVFMPWPIDHAVCGHWKNNGRSRPDLSTTTITQTQLCCQHQLLTWRCHHYKTSMHAYNTTWWLGCSKQDAKFLLMAAGMSTDPGCKFYSRKNGGGALQECWFFSPSVQSVRLSFQTWCIKPSKLGNCNITCTKSLND